MLKAVASTTDGTYVFLGLSRENTVRLLDDQPIRVNLQELDPRLPDLTVVLVGGEDEADIQQRLLGAVS